LPHFVTPKPGGFLRVSSLCGFYRTPSFFVPDQQLPSLLFLAFPSQKKGLVLLTYSRSCAQTIDLNTSKNFPSCTKVAPSPPDESRGTSLYLIVHLEHLVIRTAETSCTRLLSVLGTQVSFPPRLNCTPDPPTATAETPSPRSRPRDQHFRLAPRYRFHDTYLSHRHRSRLSKLHHFPPR